MRAQAVEDIGAEEEEICFDWMPQDEDWKRVTEEDALAQTEEQKVTFPGLADEGDGGACAATTKQTGKRESDGYVWRRHICPIPASRHCGRKIEMLNAALRTQFARNTATIITSLYLVKNIYII